MKLCSILVLKVRPARFDDKLRITCGICDQPTLLPVVASTHFTLFYNDSNDSTIDAASDCPYLSSWCLNTRGLHLVTYSRQ